MLDVKDLYKESYIGKEITVSGWIKSHRKQAHFGFIDLSDGTCFKNLQVVYDDKLKKFDDITKLKLGSAITVTGKLVESPKEGQDFELVLSSFVLEGDCPDDYPLQAKGRPTREFLRDIAYLRPRTNLFNAVFRVRSVAAYAIHKYFQDNGYVYFHAPLITSSDCEGAGEMFQVTTLDLNKVAETGKVDYDKDFFGKMASLTVSGQLEGETFAMAYKKIYTFGPTFRAENSNTKTHASEFWMIEPEMAFCELDRLMDVEEDMLRYIIKYVMENAYSELKFFDNFVHKGLIDRLNTVLNAEPKRITHKEAITILKESGKDFENKPEYGEDLAKEHEKYLTEEYFKAPVFVTDWPKDIKAFYMRLNDDNETVAAVDFLVPQAGELMGGSQREERYSVLKNRMDNLKMDEEELDWYLKLRQYGGVKHSGFGLGFERLLIYLTGMENIRDVIPFPRTPGNCEF